MLHDVLHSSQDTGSDYRKKVHLYQILSRYSRGTSAVSKNKLRSEVAIC